MKQIHDHHGKEVTLYDLSYFIYQGFGAWGVDSAIHALKEHLPNVTWAYCGFCEGDYPHDTPEGNHVCLVCGSLNTEV